LPKTRTGVPISTTLKKSAAWPLGGARSRAKLHTPEGARRAARSLHRSGGNISSALARTSPRQALPCARRHRLPAWPHCCLRCDRRATSGDPRSSASR
jgi:hypothetical protein